MTKPDIVDLSLPHLSEDDKNEVRKIMRKAALLCIPEDAIINVLRPKIDYIIKEYANLRKLQGQSIC